VPPDEGAPVTDVPGTRPRSRGEAIFLAAFSIGTLIIGLAFVVATVFWSYGFPSTVVAILFSICIGTLAYTFLGGAGGASFQLGAVKLAGAAALIIIVFYLVDGPLEKNMTDVEAIAAGKRAEGLIKVANDAAKKASTERDALKERVAEMEAGNTIKQSEAAEAIVARVRKSKPNDPVGRGVLAIYHNGEGPFVRFLRRAEMQARFHNQVPKGTFWFCHDQQPDLRGKTVTLERGSGAEGTSNKITLRAGSDIGWLQCKSITYDMQLGCDAAEELLSLTCGSNGIAWTETNGNKAYPIGASILNPEFAN
jgi:hypothetical protein